MAPSFLFRLLPALVLLVGLGISADARSETPCDGIEKSVCLSKVEALIRQGKTNDAIAGLSLLCDSRGDAEGCVGAATLLGTHGKPDLARTYATRACTQTVASGCDLLASFDLKASDYDGAQAAYERACTQSEPGACDRADRVRAQIIKRKELLVTCNAGEPEPCARLAQLENDLKATTNHQAPATRAPAPTGSAASVPDPSMSPSVLAKIKAIQAKHESNKAAAQVEIGRLCRSGEGYACALLSSAALIEGKISEARQTAETGCHEGSASACFVRYSIAKSDRGDTSADQYFSLTCRYGGLNYCAEVRRRLAGSLDPGPLDREPAQGK